MEATCTDIKQQWGRLKKNAEALYEIVPIAQFCHFNDKSEKIFYNYDINKEIDFIQVLTKGKKFFNNTIYLHSYL